jgi:hypothetical protein
LGHLRAVVRGDRHQLHRSTDDRGVEVDSAYAIGYLGFGPIIDRIGARLGYILGVFGSYQPIFALAGSANMVAIVAIHFLSPKLERVTETAVR